MAPPPPEVCFCTRTKSWWSACAGMFRQGIKDGFQQELPDIWLQNGNPWELKRAGIKYPIGCAAIIFRHSMTN